MATRGAIYRDRYENETPLHARSIIIGTGERDFFEDEQVLVFWHSSWSRNSRKEMQDIDDYEELEEVHDDW